MGKHSYVVEVKNVKKSFYLPHHKNDSIKSAITQVFQPREKGGNKFNALNGVSFNVEKGDFFGILGRNGSGKSTLLKIISEIYKPTSGSTKTRGKVVSFIELGVGFKAELTGRENIFLNGGLLGFSRPEVEAMYDDIVAFAELEDFMDQKLKNYSSGMRVRLAFSVAIRAKADVLILDEVLAVGDASFQKKCTDYFKTLKDDGKTVILVTHSMSNVRKFCNKAVVISEGKVIFDGDAETAADTYLRLFSEEPSVKVKKKIEGKKTIPLDKKVTIEAVRTVRTPEKITIEVDLKSTVKQKDVKLAVRIINSQKKWIAGVNTQSVKPSMSLDFTENETCTAVFSVDNILGSGDFTLDVIVGPTAVTGIYHDSVEDVAGFSNAVVEGHYPVVAPASFSVK